MLRNNTNKEGTWADVFAQLEKDKDKLLSDKGKAETRTEEMVFFLGEVKAVLNKGGMKFYIEDNGI